MTGGRIQRRIRGSEGNIEEVEKLKLREYRPRRTDMEEIAKSLPINALPADERHKRGDGMMSSRPRGDLHDFDFS